MDPAPATSASSAAAAAPAVAAVTSSAPPTASPAAAASAPDSSQTPPHSTHLQSVKEIRPLPPFQPDLYQRGWSSIAHPTLPLLATAHNKSVTIFSLATFSAHSSLTGGHSRSVRSATWKPGLSPNKLCLVTGSFDSTAGLWRYEQSEQTGLETEMTAGSRGDGDDDDKEEEDGWEFTLVLEGQEHEIKSVAFSPSGQYLATCSRDKSVWIWEDVGANEDDDEWETVAVLNEHEGDVKCVAWCPDIPGRRSGSGRHYSLDVLASTSYDNTTRIWREDGDGEWVCVAVLEGHESTVWGVQWEADPARTRFPRLLTWSADQTLRIWTLDEEEDDDGENGEDGAASGNPLLRSNLGGVPNTMRRSLHESWTCTAVLPRAQSRDIYSAAWSPSTGLVASTGSDGTVVVYAEFEGSGPDDSTTGEDEAAAMLDGDVIMTNGHSNTNGRSRSPARGHGHGHGHHHDHNHEHDHDHGHDHDHDHDHDHTHSHTHAQPHSSGPAKHWRVVGTVANAHGPYEINNVTWCRRFDPGAEQRGVEEMLVTTGDDGVVRPWQIVA